MDFSCSPSSSSYSQYKYKELARAAGGEGGGGGGGGRPWLTVASPDMMTSVDATTHTATATTTTTTTTSNKEDEDEAVTTNTTKNNDTEITEAAGATTRITITTTTTTAAAVYMEREHMFDKVVTPSDVGKLNRLVIPKQHAEKYFPLDSASNEKGLLLNFEDRSGKSWRFRYSYWNSSQSYVMTKGWSRFVKEKKLDAGDIISFQRGVGDICKDSFFIDWRRRQPEMIMPPVFLPPPRLLHLGNQHHPGAAAIFLPGAGYNGIPSHHHHINQYRYHTQQQYMSSSPWNSNIGQQPLPPPPALAQQQLPMVVRDHYNNPHYPGQMKQMNMINLIQQYPGNQYHQHDRGINIIGRGNTGGVHHDQYYHHQQYQNYNGNHHDQDKGYEAVVSPPRRPSTSSNIGYMNNVGSAVDRERGCRDNMVPIVQPRGGGASSSAAAAPKQLRLFGVDMDCSQDEDSNVVFGVDVVAASQHHNNIRHDHGRHDHRDHDHELTNSQNAAISAPFQLRLYDGCPTNSMSLRASSQSQLQEKGKSSSLTLDLGI